MQEITANEVKTQEIHDVISLCKKLTLPKREQLSTIDYEKINEYILSFSD